jgi:hypothetical protein
MVGKRKLKWGMAQKKGLAFQKIGKRESDIGV